jgi:hypothetical protein
MTYSTQGIIDLTIAVIKNMGVENAISAVNVHMRAAVLAKEEETILKWKNVKAQLMLAREGESLWHSVNRIRRSTKAAQKAHKAYDVAISQDYSALSVIEDGQRIVTILVPGTSP